VANRLASETSPYLLQHAGNPVDWYPWGEEAQARARDLDRPILVSIGYSACHWCHVMERESFEDEQIAALMNEHFVCIKVDREERPDVDAIYMDAVQAMTGHGGWPLNAFLTPAGVPFLRRDVLPAAARATACRAGARCSRASRSAWREQREEIEASRAIVPRLRRRRRAARRPDASSTRGARRARATAAARLRRRARRLGRARRSSRRLGDRVPAARAASARWPLHTLRRMALGGMYDQVGGGFARYSVDARWLVPHFEKMLYDNALLARAYLHGFQVTGEPLFRRVCEETLDWALRELRQDGGRLRLRRWTRTRGRRGQVLRVDATRSCASSATRWRDRGTSA
jgi:uncharacterized protein YyaL (SSP411 family)